MATDCNYDMNLINNIGNDLVAAFNDGYAHGKADTERRHGEWIAVDPAYGYYKCSECRKGTTFDMKPYNFCPNCGADMRGDSDV